MIPLSLLAFTIAIGPVLAMTVVEHHRSRSAVPAGVTPDRDGPIDAQARADDGRHLVGVA